MRRLSLLALLLATACGSLGIAQAQTLILAYKPGDTYKYGLHAVLKYTIGTEGISMPFDVELTAKEAVKVNSVDSSGTADLTITVSDVSTKTTMGETTNTSTTTSSSSVDVKIAADGHVVSVNGSPLSSAGLPGVMGSQGGLYSAILPDGAVKPGDTWSKSFDLQNPVGTGSIHIATKSTYQRNENVGSVSTAVVQTLFTTTFDLTIDLSRGMEGQSEMPGLPVMPQSASSVSPESITIQGTSPANVTSWIDPSAHRVVKTHSTGSVDATLTVNMPASAQASPLLTGPITIKGTQALDMTPA